MSTGSDTQRIVALGYITAIAIPPIGLIVGLVLARRRQQPLARHAVWIIVISLIATAVWVAVFASGAISATDNTVS
jgi:uncharacterized protein YacL